MFQFNLPADLTMAEIERRRKRNAEASKGFGQAKYVGTGAVDLVKGLMIGQQNRKLDTAERDGRASAKEEFGEFMGAASGPLWEGGGFSGGGFTTAPGSMPTGGSYAPVSGGGNGVDVVQGLIDRGMPEHIALGFGGNFAVESGFDAGINERNPLVEGSRGGFGYAQWTGPRRRQLEAFAQANGAPVHDPNVQLDFLMHELATTEKGAAQAIFAAQDPATAARLVSEKFLRPGIPHLDRRMAETQALAQALSAGGGQSEMVGGLSIRPGQPNPDMFYGDDVVPAQGVPPIVEQPGMAPQMAPQMPQTQPGRTTYEAPSYEAPRYVGPSMGAIASLAGNDFLTPAQSAVLSAYMGQAMEGMAPPDPMEQMRAQQLALSGARDQFEFEQALNPQAKPATPTDDMREFEFARQQGYQGSFADWQGQGAQGTERPTQYVNGVGLIDTQTGEVIQAYADAAGGGGTEYGLTPQWGVDAEGNSVMLQVGKDGRAVQTAMPEGITPGKDPIRLDAGTHFVLLDPVTRQPIAEIPKNNEEAAAQTARGSATGKSEAERIAQAPGTMAQAQESIALIDSVLNSPDLAGVTGMIQGRLPARNQGQQDLMVRIDQLQGRAFLEAFNSLKGGGQITEREGQAAQAAIARLQRTQSDGAYREALQELRAISERAYRRAAGEDVPDMFAPQGGAAPLSFDVSPPTAETFPDAFVNDPRIMATVEKGVPLATIWEKLTPEMRRQFGG